MIWLSVASALLAAAAAVYAYQMGRKGEGAAVWAPVSSKARRGAPLALSVLDGDVRLGQADGISRCAFLLSIVNESGTPRVFTDIGLRVRYRTAANFSGAQDVPLTDSADPGGARTGEVTLRLPLTVNPRQSIIGWAHFATVDLVPRECRVDGYAIVMKGSAGEHLVAEASLTTVIEDDSTADAPG